MILWFLPLTLVGVVVELTSALSVHLGDPVPENRSRLTTCIVLALTVIGIATAVDAWDDVVWSFWSVQFPLVSTFLMSGVFAARALEGRARGPALFFALSWLLAVTPLVIVEVWPRTHHWRRSESASLAILQLCGWSFGGPIPDSLIPFTEIGVERGVGFLPRHVTVPMSTLLIAAWSSIIFSAATFLLRCIRSERRKLTAAFVFAPLFGIVTLFLGPIGPFDPILFRPDANHSSRAWEADPDTMRSFGIVVLTGWLCTTALLVTTVRDGVRRLAVVREVDSG